MNLVVEFRGYGVLVNTITQRTKKIDMKDISKCDKPLYVVNAKEVYKGKYCVLKKISDTYLLALDNRFKLVIITVRDGIKYTEKYSYKLVTDTCKKYTNSVNYKHNKFTNQLGHIEYIHGFKNASDGMAVAIQNGFKGTLVDDKVIDGVFHGVRKIGRLYAQFKDKVVSVDVNPVYNYLNLDHKFKYNALLVGKYYNSMNLSKLSNEVLTKIAQDNQTTYLKDGIPELEYNDLDYNVKPLTPKAKFMFNALKEREMAYIYSRKYSNLSETIAINRILTSNGIRYLIISDDTTSYITLHDMLENKVNIANATITDEYIEIMGVDGHYRYNIKEYYAYYGLNFVEKSEVYKMHKILKPHTVENVRENGDLVYIKMDTHTLKIPDTCIHLTNNSIELSPSNRILHIPSSVKFCDIVPFNSIRKAAIQEVIIECNPGNIIPRFLILNELPQDEELKITIDRVDENDITALYQLNTPVKVHITDKSYRLSRIDSKRACDLLKSQVKKDTSLYGYDSKYTHILQLKIDRLKLINGVLDSDSDKAIKGLIQSLEKVKIKI